MGISRIWLVAWLPNAALISIIITLPASQTLKDAAALKAAEDEETEEASEAANKISESLSSERDAVFTFKDKMKSGAGKDGFALLQSSFNNSFCKHYNTL